MAMFKFKSLFVLSLIMHSFVPAQAGSLWEDAKRFAYQNSVKIGLLVAAAAVAYYFLAPDVPGGQPKKIIPKPNPAPVAGAWSNASKREYRSGRRKVKHENNRIPVIIEIDELQEELEDGIGQAGE